ncbi:MAG: hypothetical protein HUK22_06525 [Thermoguttaceae bacterium]|nr:hypothetical protein [Thermoguttaceae bacterium]
MPDFLFESVAFWGATAACAVVGGYVVGTGVGKRWPLFAGVALGMALAALGSALVFGVQTDRKAARRTIEELADRIAANDLQGVLGLVSEDAPRARGLAIRHLSYVQIEWTKIREFEILEINRHKSPPKARVAFRGTVSGRTSDLDAPFTVIINFREVELRLENGVWRVTDKCEFEYPGYSTDGF